MSLTQPASARRFHKLTVKEVRRETADAVSIAFAVPPALEPAFRFAPGQYLTVRALLDGEELRRTYSICTAADEGEIRVAIKQVEGGRFSTFANALLQPGSEIEVMPPMGRFTLPKHGESARTYAAFAAGSGITPVLSMVKTVLRREPRSRFFLFYGNKTSADILFKDTLDDLKDCYLDRLSVFHVLSRERQDLEILSGRLDDARVRLLLTRLLPADEIDEVFICGPPGMLEEVQAAVLTLGIVPQRIHLERFTTDRESPSPMPPAGAHPAPPAPPDAPRLELLIDGARHRLAMLEDEAIIDAGLRAGLDLPYSCRGGMCCTCRAKLVAGEVKMRENYGLEPWEIEAGYILTCQSVPLTREVTVDYDQV